MKKQILSLPIFFLVIINLINAQNVAPFRYNPEVQRQSVTQVGTDLLPELPLGKGVNDNLYYGYGETTTFYKSTLATFPTSTTVGSPGINIQAAEFIDGTFYAVTYEGTKNRFGKIDISDGKFIEIKSTFQNDAVSMCFNPTNNLTYVFAWGSNTSSPFGTVDILTGNYSPIGNVPGIFYAAIDNDGFCYGINLVTATTQKPQFGKINLSNGDFTPISTLTFNTNYVSAMFIDRETNKLYWFASNNTAATKHLYEINKQTGALTELPKPTFAKNVSAAGVDSQIAVDYCDPVSSLAYQTSGNNVMLNWEAAPGSPKGYRITFDGNVIAPLVTGTAYTHTNVPDKQHTYSVAAIYEGDCVPLEVSIKIIVGDYCMLRVEMQVLKAFDPDYPEVPTWGWDGSYIEIYSNGVLLGEPSVPHASLSATDFFIVPSGQIDFYWVNGSEVPGHNGDFDDEVTFQIYNSDDEMIFECKLGDAFFWDSYQQFFFYENDCAPPPVPCDPVTTTATQVEASINVAWTDAGGIVNVWRNNEVLALDVPGTSYLDENPISGNNCYYIEVICESGFSVSNESCVNFIGIPVINPDKFSIAPNPASNLIEIKAERSFSKIEIVNFLGQIVVTQVNDANNATVDVSNLTNGVYFVRLISEKGTSVQKFVKQ